MDRADGGPVATSLMTCKRVILHEFETEWFDTIGADWHVPTSMAIWLALEHDAPFTARVGIAPALMSEPFEVPAACKELVLEVPLANAGLPAGEYGVAILHEDVELKQRLISFKQPAARQVTGVEAAVWMIENHRRVDLPPVRFNPLPQA
ncbi:MAG: hypothetical protein H6839_09975 [Planctomycetes bacterium]|nr:hypothetical protein [Planctomycetota bacterium]